MSRKRRKNRKPRDAKKAGSQDQDQQDLESEAKDEGSESFADLMGDARPLQQGPARASAPPVASPAVAHALAARGGGAGGGGRGEPKPSDANRRGEFRWPEPEDPSRAAAEGVSDTTLFALGRGEPAPEERLDLHGTRRDAARGLLVKRLESARARGLRCLLVVHGHGKHSGGGETVLKEALPGWLSKRPCADSVLAFAPAPRDLGGAGATMVLIRRR